MNKVVISLGGSILVKDEDDASYIRELVILLNELGPDNVFIVITGGGRTARKYIGIGRDLGANESLLDSIGIQATLLNAWTMISAMGDGVYPRPVTSIEEAIIGASMNGISVGGGTHPGHTTDTVAALTAERWGADLFLNLTAVSGAYTSDPNRDDDAEQIPKMTSSELLELVSSTRRGAGSHSVLDPLASAIVHRAAIRTCILDGRDLSSVRAAIQGEKFDGTVVVPNRDGGM
ncbi:MAG: UMP kinase [Candidatus Thermoplasmatota archaeon]|nr:UMP kinase [Candidatus Thermoplasmatota archaeon]